MYVVIIRVLAFLFLVYVCGAFNVAITQVALLLVNKKNKFNVPICFNYPLYLLTKTGRAFITKEISE